MSWSSSVTSKDCIFCKIGQGEVASEMLHRDDRVFVIKDIRPKAPVHLLIIPIEHLVSLASLDSSQASVLGHMYVVADEMARHEGVSQSGYRLIVNQGPDSAQEVAHIHMHLLGGRRLGALA